VNLLDGHVAAQFQIAGAIHGREIAIADQADDFVAGMRLELGCVQVSRSRLPGGTWNLVTRSIAVPGPARQAGPTSHSASRIDSILSKS
jgi:hypothetical protein